MRHSVYSIFFDQADAHDAEGRYHRALEFLYQVHRWVPNDPDLWRRMGVLAFLTTDRDWLVAQGLEATPTGDMGAVNADLYLARATELGPEDARGHFWRGWARLKLYQDPARARHGLGKALALDATWPYTHAALARVEVAEATPGYAERALAHLDAATRALPESARFHYDRGALLAGLGRREEARQAFARTQACRPLPTAPDAASQHLATEFHGDAASLTPLIETLTTQFLS